MSEIENLLKELQNMKSSSKSIPNTPETWSQIRNGNWREAGFKSEDEAIAFLEENEYQNL